MKAHTAILSSNAVFSAFAGGVAAGLGLWLLVIVCGVLWAMNVTLAVVLR